MRRRRKLPIKVWSMTSLTTIFGKIVGIGAPCRKRPSREMSKPAHGPGAITVFHVVGTLENEQY